MTLYQNSTFFTHGSYSYVNFVYYFKNNYNLLGTTYNKGSFSLTQLLTMF